MGDFNVLPLSHKPVPLCFHAPLRARFNETTKVRTKSDCDSDFRWLKLFFLRAIRIGRELMPQSPTRDESESQKLMFWELIFVIAKHI